VRVQDQVYRSISIRPRIDLLETASVGTKIERSRAFETSNYRDDFHLHDGYIITPSAPPLDLKLRFLRTADGNPSSALSLIGLPMHISNQEFRLHLSLVLLFTNYQCTQVRESAVSPSPTSESSILRQGGETVASLHFTLSTPRARSKHLRTIENFQARGICIELYIMGDEIRCRGVQLSVCPSVCLALPSAFFRCSGGPGFSARRAQGNHQIPLPADSTVAPHPRN